MRSLQGQFVVQENLSIQTILSVLSSDSLQYRGSFPLKPSYTFSPVIVCSTGEPFLSNHPISSHRGQFVVRENLPTQTILYVLSWDSLQYRRTFPLKPSYSSLQGQFVVQENLSLKLSYKFCPGIVCITGEPLHSNHPIRSLQGQFVVQENLSLKPSYTFSPGIVCSTGEPSHSNHPIRSLQGQFVVQENLSLKPSFTFSQSGIVCSIGEPFHSNHPIRSLQGQFVVQENISPQTIKHVFSKESLQYRRILRPHHVQHLRQYSLFDKTILIRSHGG